MEFGEQLDENLVPEWRAQYLNYTTGKRYVKAISRAVVKAHAVSTRDRTFTIATSFSPYRRKPAVSFVSETRHRRNVSDEIELSNSIAQSPTSISSDEAADGVLLHEQRVSQDDAALRRQDRIPAPSRPIVAPLSIPSDVVLLREQEFFTFLDKELGKIEAFYTQKENQANSRLSVLRQQLHIMRTRRSRESKGRDSSFRERLLRSKQSSDMKQSQAFTPITPAWSNHPAKDYVKKRADEEDVSRRTAKQRLRRALQEFYRSLELLKAYSLLNLTAFRKLTKKCDKANRPNGRSASQYMNQKVHSAEFVRSDRIEEYIEAVEDLYTRYFERGNRKLARTKLRRLASAEGIKTTSAVFNGLMVGVGLTFAVEAVVLGVQRLLQVPDDDEDEDTGAQLRTQTGYLLQIYAGYFLMLYLFTWFCFCCRIWNAFKINYAFIFEFDRRHDLDWKQLSEFPSVLTLLMGIIMWLNFSDIGGDTMYLWYPVILIGVTLLMIFLPLPILRWRSRRWFVIAHGRLLCAGLFAVEFRDFFLGDMYCSLVYATANAELFFCLYSRSWQNPVQCDSRHSILLGFLAALPPIWRALQCVRRFWDSKQAFPHLANLLKYLFTISTAVTLSLYRRSGSHLTLMMFIAFSAVNAFYALIWDILMDFSLLQPGSKNTGLRDILAFESQIWMYYGIMIVDPILRFNWIFLAIFSRNIQHGSVAVFFVALSEVTRRGLWTIFRVENEHCTNIRQAKASRDIPLPYKVNDQSDEIPQSASLIANDALAKSPRPPTRITTPVMEEGRAGRGSLSAGSPAMELYRAFSRRLANAHARDFQRRRRPETVEEHQLAWQRDQHLNQEDDSEIDPEETYEPVSEEGNEDEARQISLSIANVTHKPPPA